MTARHMAELHPLTPTPVVSPLQSKETLKDGASPSSEKEVVETPLSPSVSVEECNTDIAPGTTVTPETVATATVTTAITSPTTTTTSTSTPTTTTTTATGGLVGINKLTSETAALDGSFLYLASDDNSGNHYIKRDIISYDDGYATDEDYEEYEECYSDDDIEIIIYPTDLPVSRLDAPPS